MINSNVMLNSNITINNIVIGIDRIELTMPRAYLNSLHRYLNEYKTQIPSKQYKRYIYDIYTISGNKLTLKYLEPKYSDSNFRDRIYLTASDPDNDIQTLLRKILSNISGGITKGFAGVLINQIEVSYDIYCLNESDSYKIKEFIKNYLILKHARPESYKTIGTTDETTDYIGRKGNARKGIKGLRSYVKNENNELFYRLEMQYNRPYITSNDLTIQDLPFNPLSFNSFDYIELLDNFSDKGLKNISRSLLRKKGITESLNHNCNKLYREQLKQLRSEVLTETKQAKRPVHTQIAKLKSIKNESGLSVNVKQYFRPLYDVHQLICCLADTGYLEDYCSKRMAWCQAA